MSSAQVCIYKLGLVDYLKALKIQNKVALALKDGLFPYKRGVLLILEHTPVYTVGLRKSPHDDKDEHRLRSLGADFVRSNRGGLITFHGPGQLVVWPVLNLKYFKTSIRWYIDTLEETVITLCLRFGLSGARSPHTGVWLGDNKICAIGVHASRFVTTHGLAINCCTDLSWFDHIIPCGIPDKGVTSLSHELNRTVTISEVIPYFLDSFQKTFNCHLMESVSNDAKKILQENESLDS